MLPRNVWYVAAHSAEITPQPLARRILDEPLVLFRTASGRVAILEDRCIHRLLPLSRGRVVAEHIQCPYHGAEYDGDGRCAVVPGQAEPPAGARVRSYPAVEQHGFVWVWTGDPALASAHAPSPILAFLDAGGFDTLDGYLHIGCGYELMNDNLADVTHAEFVHRSTLGMPDIRVARQDGRPPPEGARHSFRADVRPGGIDFEVGIHDTRIAPAFERGYARHHGREEWGHLDFEMEFVFRAPGLWIFAPWIKEPGVPRAQGLKFHVPILLTPETARSHHYFYRTCQRYAPQAREETAYWHAQVTTAFTEDQVLLEAQQAALGASDVHDHRNVSFQGDRLGIQARRLVRSLVDAEAGAPAR